MQEMAEYSRSDDPLPDHLQRLRNHERVELIMSFYRGLKIFRELSRRSHTPSYGIRFEGLDQLIETHLRLVKDTCHKLFRESKRGEADRILQAFFDMYFGVLFHILLKAKENLRLRESYNVQRLEGLLNDLRKTRPAAGLPVGIRQLFGRLALEFQRDSKELAGEMAGARFMFNQLEKIFNRIIQVYGESATIIRSLYCQKDFFAELFPSRGIDRLFGKIYRKNGPTEAYLFLGFDFLRSGHVAEASESFAQAIRVAKAQRMPRKRLQELCDTYRNRTIAQLSGPGHSMLAFRLRLRELESQPAFRWLAGDHPNYRERTVER